MSLKRQFCLGERVLSHYLESFHAFTNNMFTEYTATIQRENGELLWTLKYTEWGPNNSDRDLAGPYKTEKPMDSRYVYANHDGSIIGVDRSRGQ